MLGAGRAQGIALSGGAALEPDAPDIVPPDSGAVYEVLANEMRDSNERQYLENRSGSREQILESLVNLPARNVEEPNPFHIPCISGASSEIA
jgi:hypothetical protein